jgi:ankyrin repeat protein
LTVLACSPATTRTSFARTESDAVRKRYGFIWRLGNQTVDIDAEDRVSGYFVQVPNELKLMFADCLALDDINTLVRTSRALNRFFTPYMYHRAKDLYSNSRRPYFSRAVDADNLTAVKHLIEVGTSVNVYDPMSLFLPTALHSCVYRGNIAIARLLIRNGVNISPTNRSGMTPLHWAVAYGKPSEIMVTLLLDAGAQMPIFSHDTVRLGPLRSCNF